MRASPAIAGAAIALGCGAQTPMRLPERAIVEAPTRPASCREISPSEDVAAIVGRSTSGDVLCLSDGTWVGQLVVPAGVTLWGPRSAVVKTIGTGTTIELRSGSKLLGVTVDGSGGRFDVLDAAVQVNGDDVTVEGVRVVNAAFGILVQKSRRARVRGNHVVGPGGPLGVRGDGIRMWEVRDSIVEGNLVERSRDCVVWYSSNNRLLGNEIVEGRYGAHFMYSHDNQVVGNVYRRNEVGIFAMYSRNLTVESNFLASSGGTSGIGLGLKESGNVFVRRNLFIHNTQGIFIDTSPLDPKDENVFEDNVLQLSDVAIGFLSSQRDNTFQRNTLRDNRTQVRVEGGGDALQLVWRENDWDDYVGYDLDGDGIGDIPYELRDLSGALLARHLDLAFLDGTPALALVSIAGRVAPLLAPKPVLRDERPRLEVQRAN